MSGTHTHTHRHCMSRMHTYTAFTHKHGRWCAHTHTHHAHVDVTQTHTHTHVDVTHSRTAPWDVEMSVIGTASLTSMSVIGTTSWTLISAWLAISVPLSLSNNTPCTTAHCFHSNDFEVYQFCSISLADKRHGISQTRSEESSKVIRILLPLCVGIPLSFREWESNRKHLSLCLDW